MEPELVSKVIQVLISTIIGIGSLFYYKRLAAEITKMFIDVYGKTFGIEFIFESKWMKRYLEFTFILFGIFALLFGLFSVMGPINDWFL